jgi:hypothetical protein
MSAMARRYAIAAVPRPLWQAQGCLSVLGGTRTQSTNEAKDNILPVSLVEGFLRAYVEYCTVRESKVYPAHTHAHNAFAEEM